MAYKTIYTEVEVDVDLNEFDTDDLIEELDSRNVPYGSVVEPISRYEAAFLRGLLDQARATGMKDPIGVSLWGLDEKLGALS
jgi:hypothetical protein